MCVSIFDLGALRTNLFPLLNLLGIISTGGVTLQKEDIVLKFSIYVFIVKKA